jgi:hypothetical protein
LTPAAIVVGGILLWLVKQVLGPLIGQQAKGSIPDYTAGKARKAARLLPPDLAEEYEQAWVAELKGPDLENKPLSALKFAHGLRHAARRIRVKAGLSRFRLVEFARLVVGRRLSAWPFTVRDRVVVMAWAVGAIMLLQAVLVTVSLTLALGPSLLVLPALLLTVILVWTLWMRRHVFSDARKRRKSRVPKA